jgi:Tfp pilus assembly protein PilN
MLPAALMPKAATDVCITLLPSFDRMELVELNPVTGQLLHIGSIGFEGNPSNKSIPNIEAFEEQLKLLIEQSGINKRSAFRLILPSLYTRVVTKPEVENDDELEPLLQLECENFFIFKKMEPAVAWSVSARDDALLLAAYPKVERDRLLAVFEHLRLNVVAVELNYSSLLKGLAISQLLTEELENDQPWHLLVVQENLFFIAYLEGDKVVSVFEAPLSRGHDAESHWLNDISQDFTAFASGMVSQRLVLVNNTLQLASELLIKRLPTLPNEPVVIEQNALTVASLGASEPRYQCTLESLGSSLMANLPAITTLDFIPKSLQQAGQQHSLQTTGLLAVIALNVLAVVVVLASWGIISLVGVSESYELDQLQKKPSLTQTLTLSNANLTQRLFVAKALLHNKHMNDVVINTAINLPNHVWLDMVRVAPLSAGAEGATAYQLEGGSLTPDDVNGYLSKLNTLTKKQLASPGLGVRLNRLMGQPDEQAVDLLEVSKLDVSALNTNLPDLPPHYQWVMQSKTLDANQQQQLAAEVQAPPTAESTPAAGPPAGAPPPTAGYRAAHGGGTGG